MGAAKNVWRAGGHVAERGCRADRAEGLHLAWRARAVPLRAELRDRVAGGQIVWLIRSSSSAQPGPSTCRGRRAWPARSARLLRARVTSVRGGSSAAHDCSQAEQNRESPSCLHRRPTSNPRATLRRLKRALSCSLGHGGNGTAWHAHTGAFVLGCAETGGRVRTRPARLRARGRNGARGARCRSALPTGWCRRGPRFLRRRWCPDRADLFGCPARRIHRPRERRQSR